MPADLIGPSASLTAARQALALLAPLQCPVWITGETGVGKKLAGRYLHQLSQGKTQQLIVFDCLAISPDQHLAALESAAQKASGASLLIADALQLSPESQPYLLSLLSSHHSLNFRLIISSQPASEHLAPPWFAVKALTDNRIDIPPLNERPQDIVALLEHFLEQYAQEFDVAPKQLDSKALEVLTHYSWPGNIRQLKGCCRWLTLMVIKDQVGVQDLPPEILSFSQEKAEQWVLSLSLWAQKKLEDNEPQLLNNALSLFEHTLIKAALKHTGGRRQEAAKLLGIGRNTLTRKLHEFSINPKPDKE